MACGSGVRETLVEQAGSRLRLAPVGLAYTIVVVTCEDSWASGGALVLVGESAEGLFSADPVIFEVAPEDPRGCLAFAWSGT